MSDTTKVEALLAELPIHRAPDGWRDRVRAAIAADTPPAKLRGRVLLRPLWIAGGAVLAAAACVMLYLAFRGAPAPSIAMQVVRQGHAYRDLAAASVGDTIVIRVSAAAAFRVYRNGMLIAQCPGDAACLRGSDGLELALPVTSAGNVSAIAFTPALPAPARDARPSATDLDADLALAASMQITMAISESLDVR